jgi:hypothetical protein
VAIISAVTGVLLTVIVTKSLLNKQSANALDKDIEVKRYEERLKIYKDFLFKLYEVVKDGKISDEEVKELIFHTSYIAMHTSSERIDNILRSLTKVIAELNADEGKYEKLAKNVLDIDIEMQYELYGKRLGEKNIDPKCFNTFVSDTEDAAGKQQVNEAVAGFDKKTAQVYFWKELIKQLKLKGYSPAWSTSNEIEQDVEIYYAKARYRHRYFGFKIDVKKAKSGREVCFCVEIENDYYYGFAWANEPYADESLSQIIREFSLEYKTNQGWAGWKWPKLDLDFWKRSTETTTNMKRLSDPAQREELMKEIAEEMAEQIEAFKKIAEKNNL